MIIFITFGGYRSRHMKQQQHNGGNILSYSRVDLSTLVRSRRQCEDALKQPRAKPPLNQIRNARRELEQNLLAVIQQTNVAVIT